MVLLPQRGNVVIENVGNGVALNVRYDFIQTTPEPDGLKVSPGSYLQHIPTGKPFVVPVPRGTLQNKEYDFLARYESVGGREYESRIHLNNLVITQIAFVASKTVIVAEGEAYEHQRKVRQPAVPNVRTCEISRGRPTPGLRRSQRPRTVSPAAASS